MSMIHLINIKIYLFYISSSTRSKWVSEHARNQKVPNNTVQSFHVINRYCEIHKS